MQTQVWNQHQPIGRLKQVCGSVSEFDDSVIEIKNALYHTMVAFKGLVGSKAGR